MSSCKLSVLRFEYGTRVDLRFLLQPTPSHGVLNTAAQTFHRLCGELYLTRAEANEDQSVIWAFIDQQTRRVLFNDAVLEVVQVVRCNGPSPNGMQYNIVLIFYHPGQGNSAGFVKRKNFIDLMTYTWRIALCRALLRESNSTVSRSGLVSNALVYDQRLGQTIGTPAVTHLDHNGQSIEQRQSTTQHNESGRSIIQVDRNVATGRNTSGLRRARRDSSEATRRIVAPFNYPDTRSGAECSEDIRRQIAPFNYPDSEDETQGLTATTANSNGDSNTIHQNTIHTNQSTDTKNTNPSITDSNSNLSKRKSRRTVDEKTRREIAPFNFEDSIEPETKRSKRSKNNAKKSKVSEAMRRSIAPFNFQ